MNQSKPVEILTFDFLAEAIVTAQDDSILKNLELHDTIYQSIKTDAGLRISDAESDLALSASGELQEFDAVLEIICFARITTSEKRERLNALNKVFEISKAVTRLLIEDPSMGGRVCDAFAVGVIRAYDNIKADTYAVSNIPIVINQSGKFDFSRRPKF